MCRWASVDGLCEDWDGLWSLLAADERKRAERFVVEGARRRFVAGRALLRRLLADSTGDDPARVDLTVDDHDRPCLVGTPRIGFNVSHSGDRVVVVLTGDARVGVDVEELRPVDRADALARRFFAPREAASVAAAAGARRDLVFLHVWTCKEAWLKAVGLGIRVPLPTVEVDPNPSRPARLVLLPAGYGDPAAWSLLDADTGHDHLCRVAVEGTGWELDVRGVRRLG